jgi:two-component sensor histidine kinase
MKRIIVFIFFIFTASYLSAQALPSLPDSLQTLIDTASTTESKAEAFIVAGDYYYAFYTTDGYNKSADYYNKSLHIAIEKGNKTYEGYSYKSLGAVYDALGDEYLPKALEYYDKFKQIAITHLKDTGTIAGASILVANVQQKTNDKNACKNSIDKALSYLPINSFEGGYNQVLMIGAFYMSRLNDYAACKQYFQQITKEPSFFKNENFPLRKYYLATQMYLNEKEKKYNEAFRYGKLGLKEAANKSDSMELLGLLASFADKTGNYKEAYQLRDTEFELYREVVKAESLKSTDNSLLKSELFLKEENAKLLQKQKNLQQQFNYWLLAGLLLTAVFAVVIFRFAAQRRKQNKILHAQNEEKAMLLGEIHHRVKNNLEMLQSMLLLQMREYKDDETVQAALGEANNRIQSIALLHKQLYSGNLAHTNANIYFTEMLSRIIGDLNNRREFPVQQQLAVDAIELPPDTILPLALLINEWITNSTKYAFAKTQMDPGIELQLQQQADGLYILYSDNGKNDTDSQQSGTGFGSRLIHSLVKQLRGKLQTTVNKNGWSQQLIIPFTNG